MKTGFKTLALWLGLIALTIQALAPLCLGGQAQAAETGGNTIVICTSHGIETVTLGDDGKPVKQAPASGHHVSDCTLCGTCLMGGFTAPSAIAFDAPSVSVGDARAVIAAPAASRPNHFFYVGRAPPKPAQAALA